MAVMQFPTTETQTDAEAMARMPATETVGARGVW